MIAFRKLQKRLTWRRTKDTELLAGFMRGKLDKGIVEYIDRNPALLAELKTFKSKYGNSWTEEACGR